MNFLRRIHDAISSPVGLRRFNGWTTVFWTVAFFGVFVVQVRTLYETVLFVTMVSLYANWISQLTAWIGGRNEVRIEELQGENERLKRALEMDERLLHGWVYDSMLDKYPYT